jgi:hypothetical protein
MSLRQASGFLSTGEIPEITPYMNGQVLREIQYILSQRRLVPRVYLSYERRAFTGDGQSGLRVSFDTDIITRRTDLRLTSGIYGERLIPEGKWVMEVKTAQSIPVWLSRLLSEYRIYPVSFSKYGTEYKASLMPEDRKPQGSAIMIPARAFPGHPETPLRAAGA